MIRPTLKRLPEKQTVSQKKRCFPSKKKVSVFIRLTLMRITSALFSFEEAYINLYCTQVSSGSPTVYWTCSYLALLMFLARQQASAAPNS